MVLPNLNIVTGNVATYTQLALQSYNFIECPQQFYKRNKTAKNELHEINVFPNPCSDGFTLTNMPSNWKLQINNITGELIFIHEGVGNTFIPSNLLVNKGCHIITITNSNTHEQINKKIFVH